MQYLASQCLGCSLLPYFDLEQGKTYCVRDKPWIQELSTDLGITAAVLSSALVMTIFGQMCNPRTFRGPVNSDYFSAVQHLILDYSLNGSAVSVKIYLQLRIVRPGFEPAKMQFTILGFHWVDANVSMSGRPDNISVNCSTIWSTWLHI